MSIDPNEPNSPPFSRSDFLGASAAALLGLAFSTLPNWLAWLKHGSFAWIADQDALLYLAVAAKAYFHHPFYLSDPAFAGADKVVMYPALQFVPAVLTAKVLGTGPLSIDFIWRIWAGLSIGLAWYAMLRQFFPGRLLSVGLAAFLMAEPGLVAGHPVLGLAASVRTASRYGMSELIAGKPALAEQWRIITPGLSMGFFILYLILLVRALRNPRRTRVTLAGAGLGLLSYEYFYYWTTAGLGLLLAMCLDRHKRWTYFRVGVIGTALGSGALVRSALDKSMMNPDSLPRLDSFLPIPHFSELLIPRLAVIFLLVCGYFCLRFRRDLIFLLGIAAAAFLLLNEQVVTGLQISNFHWNYALGPSLTVMIILLVAEPLATRARGRPALRYALAGLLVLHAGLGIGLRAIDGARSQRSVVLNADLERFLTQGAGAIALEPDAVLAGDPAFTRIAAVLYPTRELDGYCTQVSPSISNAELDERTALEAFLSGADAREFESTQRNYLRDVQTGPWIRDAALFEQRLGSRVHAFERISENPEIDLDRFEVRYVALAMNQFPPPYLRNDWVRIEAGPFWQVWKRADQK